MQKKQNPVFLALGVCGGCALLAILVIGVAGVLGYNKSKGLINGAMNMANNMPLFLNQVQAKNYEGAASLVNTELAPDLTASKIKSIEEKVEKKLGPLQSFDRQPSNHTESSSATSSGAAPAKPSVTYTYEFRLKYAKGTATATMQFYEPDFLNMKGKVTAFDIVPDNASDSETPKKGANKGKTQSDTD